MFPNLPNHSHLVTRHLTRGQTPFSLPSSHPDHPQTGPFVTPPLLPSRPNPGIQEDTATSSMTMASVKTCPASTSTNVTTQVALTHTQSSPAPPKTTSLAHQGNQLIKHQDHKLPTPINPFVLSKLLKQHNIPSQYLISGFTKGFYIHNSSFHPSTLARNLKSAFQHPDQVILKLNKELQSGRLAGPFSTPPLKDFVVSPIGLMPKKEPGQFRLIHDLSSPHGSSINDGIPKEFSTVQYQTVAQAIEAIVMAGPSSYLAKSDIKSAFRLIPLHPSQYHMFGITWQGQFYFDKCLPMGCSSSCRIFEAFSSALHAIIQARIPNTMVIHVLDDFLFISPSQQDCFIALNHFKHICHLIGVPLAPEKTIGPSQSLPFLGINLDTVKMEASLPQDKIDQMLQDTNFILSAKSVTLKHLQSINGLLNFACQVLAPARAFLRSLFDLTIGVPKPHHHIHLPKHVKEDVRVWQHFLNNFNGKSFFLDFKFLSNHTLQLFTDASSSIGFGGFLQSSWFSGLWHPSSPTYHITILELYPILLALTLWGHKLSNKCLLIRSDNIAVVHIINSFTSKNTHLMVLLRHLVLVCLKFNIFVRAKHLPGVTNITADLLSRNQVSKAKLQAPQLEDNPTEVPSRLQLHNLLREYQPCLDTP